MGRRYRAKGKAGLEIKSGRGRKPAFPLSIRTERRPVKPFYTLCTKAPKEFGQSGTHWKLQTLLKACKWLCLKSLAGLWQLLKRLRIHWKRAHVHSPDLHYVEKLSWVKVNFLNFDLETNVFLFQDEYTFYRQPSLTWASEAVANINLWQNWAGAAIWLGGLLQP